MDRVAILKNIEALKDYMFTFGVFHDSAECNEYIEAHYHRFIKTLEKIPGGSGNLLEIGAAPFCMTLLMKEALDYNVRVINYGSHGDIRLVSDKYGREFVIPCAGINVECDTFPYADTEFDIVVCAEVIEHLTFYPTFMLQEIHRILKPDGLLILTTPNVLRLIYNYASARDLFSGRNFYDPYSGYGPYGRHNREFTPQELRSLVEGCGFNIQEFEVCDIPQLPEPRRNRFYRSILSLLFGVPRETSNKLRASQILLTAQPGQERTEFLPDSLYKSTHAIEKARRVFPLVP